MQRKMDQPIKQISVITLCKKIALVAPMAARFLFVAIAKRSVYNIIPRHDSRGPAAGWVCCIRFKLVKLGPCRPLETDAARSSSVTSVDHDGGYSGPFWIYTAPASRLHGVAGLLCVYFLTLLVAFISSLLWRIVSFCYLCLCLPTSPY